MNRRRTLRFRFCAKALIAVALVASGFAYAEKADREKPIHVESDRLSADDLKQVAIFEGKVILNQGTSQLRGDRLILRQDKAGGVQYSTVIGKPATFRTKRDGLDEWIEGEAERIEYDTKTERVELFVRARLNRDKDEVRGNYITYESRTEVLQVLDAKPDGAVAAGPPAAPRGRVRATFNPKPKPAPPGTPGTPGTPAAPAPGAPNPPQAVIELRPSQGITAPR